MLALEAEALDDPDTQLRHAVGRFANPVLQETRCSAASLVVASDGCCLRQWVASGDAMLTKLPGWLEAVSKRKARDDMTCLVVAPEAAHPIPLPDPVV